MPLRLSNYNNKKMVALFLQPMLHLHPAKLIGTFITSTHTNIIALPGSEGHGRALNSFVWDVKILCKQGLLKEALSILNVMDQRGIRPDSSIYASLLQGCTNMRTLSAGKLVHTRIIQTGFKPDTLLGTKLVIMYSKCGSLDDARRVKDEMPEGNVISWTAIIGTYAKHGDGVEALRLFYQMQRAGIQPDQFTFASVLPACANLEALDHGKNLHEYIIRTGLRYDILLGNALVNMYAKCGSMKDARQVFDTMPERNVVSWNTMTSGYAQNGQFDEVLMLFRQMQLTGVKPNSITFASVLSVCANLAALQQGREIHNATIRSEFQSDVFVGSALIDMYAKCGSIANARQVFDKMPERNIVSWTAMFSGYSQIGHVDEALKLFREMPKPDMVSWSAMIALSAQSGHFDEALKLFQQMQLKGVKPNSITFTSVLPAYANLKTLKEGKDVHGEIIRNGFQSDIFVETALIDMYAKCGSIENALKVFDKMQERNVISWNVMITGYVQNEKVDEALKLFQKMPERNVVSWNAMIAVYAESGHVDEALEIFQNMPDQNVASWNAIIGGYAQNGHINQALKLFQKMPGRDMVSWSSMIAVYAQNGHFECALKLFQQMRLTGLKPNSVTFTSALLACANLACLRQGREIHGNIIRSGVQSNVFVGSALVDMYAKCGSIDDAHRVFDKMPERNVVSWNAMITGYALHGRGKEALQLFEQMEHSGMKPDHVTFIGVLSACRHAGLMDDGWQYFDRMSQDYHIKPAVEHYCCIVDLLGRAGKLNEARDFINKMPIKPDAAVWGSLLGACRIHSNIELAEHVAQCLFELDSENSAHYVLLSNIYAAAGRWDDKEKVRKVMKDRRLEKTPGCSSIEVNNKVYSFLIGDG